MGIFSLTLFNYFRRYKWTAANFTLLQEQLIGYSQTQLAALCQNAVLSGFNQNGSSGLNANYLAGVAINSDGALLAKENNGSVAVTDNVMSLIVIRPATTQINSISRPTAPFDPVFLNSLQDSSVVAIDGTISAYPSPAAGDIVLFGVTASGGSITQIDETQCQLIGKSGELSAMNDYDRIVGNHRICTHLTLDAAFTGIPVGTRVRVMDNFTVDTVIITNINDLKIDFDPGVVYTKGAASNGLLLTGIGIRMTGGRFINFSSGGDKAIRITGNFCSIWGTRFLNNDTDIDDVTGNNSFVGIITE